MDREKLLKRYIVAVALQAVSASSYWFLFLSRKELGIKSIYLIPLLALLFASSVYIDKKSLPVMPLILSIHDTVEKFEKQNTVLYVIFFIWFVISFCLVWTHSNIVSNIVAGLIFLIPSFINVNNKRIDYLKSKPEGMNF